MWVLAVVLLLLAEFVAFLVWLAHEPKHYNKENDE